MESTSGCGANVSRFHPPSKLQIQSASYHYSTSLSGYRAAHCTSQTLAWRLLALSTPGWGAMVSSLSNADRWKGNIRMGKLERWRELCAEAAVEQDPQRLLQLVEEMNRIFEEGMASGHHRGRASAAYAAWLAYQLWHVPRP